MVKNTAYEILFIGLIFNVLLLMFIGVAILLIYSLLMISVETKTFEIGVMRMVGLSKRGFVAMLFIQAGCFVFPSVIAGFICSMPCIGIIYSIIFTAEMGFHPTIFPGPSASLQALAIGFVIPILSAIPIVRHALKANLNDALSTTRKSKSNSLVIF